MKTAIFDLDGTLLDSMDVWQQVDVDFLADHGFDLPDDYCKAIRGMHFAEIADYTIARFGLTETPEEVMAQWRALAMRAYQHTVQEKPFVPAYLAQLQQQGVRIVAATASEACFIEPALTRTGLLPFFETVVYVQEVKRGKGFPDIYLEAARRVNTAPCDCVVFEDILTAAQCAKQAGFQVIAVADLASMDDQSALKSIADQYIDDFSQLLLP